MSDTAWYYLFLLDLQGRPTEECTMELRGCLTNSMSLYYNMDPHMACAHGISCDSAVHCKVNGIADALVP
jgi:hypothetical protein